MAYENFAPGGEEPEFFSEHGAQIAANHAADPLAYNPVTADNFPRIAAQLDKEQSVAIEELTEVVNRLFRGQKVWHCVNLLWPSGSDHLAFCSFDQAGHVHNADERTKQGPPSPLTPRNLNTCASWNAHRWSTNMNREETQIWQPSQEDTDLF